MKGKATSKPLPGATALILPGVPGAIPAPPSLRPQPAGRVAPAPSKIALAPRRPLAKQRAWLTCHAAFQVGSRLHVGCGPKRLSGWVNADVVPGVGDVTLDLHDPASLPASTFAAVYACHVLEHCWPQDTPDILKRLRNSLLPGGTLRVSVPDLRLVVANCVDSQAYGGERSALAVLYGGDFSKATSGPDRHRQAFWRERLERLLREAGFENIREWGPGQYREIDALGDYATQPRGPDGKSLISLNLEADRPGTAPRPAASGATVDVSVLLGTVNRPCMLRECIEAVRDSLSESGLSYEVVVAYGAEDDASLPWMREQPDVIAVLGGTEGAIEAFNRAYAASKGRLVCQLNDDVLVDGDSIARAARHLDADPGCAAVVFKFDRGDGQGYRHEWLGAPKAGVMAGKAGSYPSLHPNQMVARRETCEAVAERIGAFWGGPEYRTDKTYGGDSAFGAVCRHLGLRMDSVEGVTCRDRCGEAADAIRAANAKVDPRHGERWRATYGPLIEMPAGAPGPDEWPNLYVPRPGAAPRRSPVEAGRPLRLLHLSLRTQQEPQDDMRRAFSKIGPTVEVPWELIRRQCGRNAANRAIVEAAHQHAPDLVWAQVHGPWDPELHTALRAAVGPGCTLAQWTGDVRTSGGQPVARWLVDFGRRFDLVLADGTTYPRKLKLEEGVPADCGYMACGIDPCLNPWRPDEPEAGGAVFLGSCYDKAHFGENDRAAVLEEAARLAPGLLTIYGFGWDKTRLAKIARPFVPQAQASLVMRKAAVTVSTSLYNDLARYTSDRLKRAAASGAVTAVRRFPDMDGLGLRPGENCLAWSTPAELAAILKEWAGPARAAERARIRANAAGLAHRRFTWDTVTEELLAIVRDHRARRGLS